jgi:hypothetical protein
MAVAIQTPDARVVCSDIDEEISSAEEMQYKHHICKFMEAKVDISCGSRHAPSNCKALPSNPWNNNFFL